MSCGARLLPVNLRAMYKPVERRECDMSEQLPRVALVTGGAKGIGAGIAARLSGDGWRVVVADREPGGMAPPGGRYAVCDVGDEAAVSALIRSIAATRTAAGCAGLQRRVHDPQADRWFITGGMVLGTGHQPDQHVSAGAGSGGPSAFRPRCRWSRSLPRGRGCRSRIPSVMRRRKAAWWR